MATTYPKIPAYPNILNGGTGATSIEVTSTDNTVTQNGASSFNPTTKSLTVDLSADKIPSYDEYADLPDPTTVELRSYAAVNQTTQIGGQLQTAGIYNILTVGGVEGQYWSFLGEYPDNITIKYGNEVLYVNTGTSANQILQLDGEAKVPAVDASQTTVGTVVPTNAIVSDNDSINTSVNKLQGQIDNALKPLSPAVNNNIVTTTSTGTLKDSGFNINNSLPYSNPLPTEVADALSTYNYMISLANATNGLPAVLLYFDTNQTLSGLPTQGDYTCVDNDRVILTNQTNPAENLIYNVHSGAWTIAPDSTKVNQLLGAYTEIIKGTYSISWTYLVSISPSSGDFVPTSVTWSVPIPSGLYQAGAGLSLTGSVFSVADNGVTNAKLAQSGANTYKGNNTGALANVQDIASGALTEATSSVLNITGGDNALLNSASIQVKQATTSVSGYLSSTDWTTFNDKQNALTNPVTSSSASATNNQLAVFNGTNNQVSSQTTLPTTAVPAFIGDITNTTGSLNTTISNNAVTNAKLNTMATNTIKANITGSTANPQDITIAQLNTSLSINTNTQYVTPLGSDTNNGYTPSTGVATLGQALTNLGNVSGIIFISPKVGGYSGDYTITSQNINIVSLSPNQAVDFNGTLTFTHTASNVQLNNISCEILNHTGNGALYMFGGSVTTSLTSSGNGYLYTSGVDLQATATTVNITGAKSVVFTNATALGQLTINNASAIVSLLNCLNSKTITLTSGVVGINNSTIYSASAGANAISVSPGAFLFATNSTFLIPNTTNPALINIPAGSFYSINNCAYSDSSVIAGTILTRTSKFDAIALANALPFTSGGTGATTRQAALNSLANAVTTGQYLRGNGTNVLMSAIQASDVPTLNQNTTGTSASVTGTNVVTNTNLSTMATNTLKGNNTVSTATPIDLTSTQVTAILDNFVGDSGSGGTKGLVPAPASGDGVANKYLNATGSWSVPAGGSTIESQYIRIKPASGINTWDANRRMRVSQILNSLGSNITLASTGIVRLVSAGTYELTAVWQGTAGGGGGTICWYNETSGAFVGQESIICPPDSGNTSTPNSVLYYTITITSPTNFSIRETGNGNMQPNAINSYVIARQLNAPTPTTVNDVPTGTIIQNVSPNIGGYLLCNGNNYNRNDYIALFNLLNTEKGTCTIAISTPAVITLTNHELTTGQKVYFTTTGALPTGLTANTTYWINVTGINTFNLSSTYANLIAGIYIATSGTQSGVHTAFLTIASVSNETTFNTPDYQGKVLANANALNGVGKFTGTETQTLTIANLPSHTHVIRGDSGSGIGDATSADRVIQNNGGALQDTIVRDTDATGSGTAHNNMQPTEFVYFHIKY
jgi:microcystin-dependent protein